MKILIYCIIMFAFFSFNFCSQKSEKDGERLTSTIDTLSQELDKLHNYAENSAIEIAKILQKNNKKNHPHFPDRKYLYYDKNMFYNPQNNGFCSVFGFGSPRLSKSQFNNLWALEKIESQLKDLVNQSAIADRAYIITQDQLGFFYPFFDVLSYISPNHNLHEDMIMVFNLNNHIPDNSVVWTAPYLDTAGLGYVITIISLIKVDDKVIGTFSIDISIKTIGDFMVNEADYPILLLSKDSVLIASNEQAISSLPLENLRMHFYLKRPKKLILAPDQYRLNLHSSPEIRVLADMVFQNKHFQIKIADKSYSGVSIPIPRLDWRLVQLIPN